MLRHTSPVLSLLLLAPLCITASAHAENALQIVSPTVEYLTNPLGVEAARPRLAWKLSSSVREVRQTAYQIKVWDDQRPLWDSGKVMSSESTHVTYAGEALHSRQGVQWQVRVWDNHGGTAESLVATWEMGLLRRSDWKGHWISTKREQSKRIAVVKPGLFWLWYPEGDPAVLAPSATRHFRRTFTVPSNAVIKNAYLGCAADARAELRLNGKSIGYAWGVAKLAAFDVSDRLAPGQNILEAFVSNGGEAGGLLAQLNVAVHGKPPLLISTDKQWEASKDGKAWVPALQAAPLGKGKYWTATKSDVIDVTTSGPAVQLRTAFTLVNTVKTARLYATALGIYEVEINGRKVGTDLLAPGWTDYKKRVQYQTYDVTSLLKQKNNAMGAFLADGWFAGKVGFADRGVYGDTPSFLANLVVTYADGKSETITTGPTWKSAAGPILQADLQDGESFDARGLVAGWSSPEFDDTAWKAVKAVPHRTVKAALVAERSKPVRAFETRMALAVTEPRPGVFVYDFGQNLPGFARLTARAAAGTRVTLRFAEILNPDGTLYTMNLRTAAATDRYIFAGTGVAEIWQPRFTVHGFRYAEISGWPKSLGQPTKDMLVAVVVHSDIPKTGTFRSSSKMVNQLVSNIDWGQRGNFLSVPTDCPQRDERLGWMGDAQIFVRTAARNRDVAAFFTKWLVDVRDGQSAAGAFPDVAPRAGGTGESAPAWADAGVIVPWVLFEEYGDRQLLAASYPSMVKWVQFVQRKNPDFLWTKNLGNSYGDWLSIAADTDKSVLATAFFAYSAQLVSQAASILGNEPDMRKFAQLATKVRAAFTKAFVDFEGRIKSDTQTAYVLALRFDMLPEAMRAQAAAHLVKNIEAHGNHLTTGFLGVGHLLPALTRFGQIKTAYALLNNDTFPSWGYSIKQGATTIWERWDGWTKEKGFQTPGMNSFNHYSLGSVGEWLNDTVAGLSPAAPGYKRIRIAPQPGGNLTEAAAELETPYGKAKSGWTLRNNELQLVVQVPPNTDAVVVLPGKPTKIPPQATPVNNQTNIFSVGSGSYEFSANFLP